MQHKLYNTLIDRLNDGTISVETVKHPVSFGQVSVLIALGENNSNMLVGATAAESDAYKAALNIMNEAPSLRLDRIRSVMSPLALLARAFDRIISGIDKETLHDFAEMFLQVSKGDVPAPTDIAATAARCAKSVARRYSSPYISEDQSLGLLQTVLTSAMEYQLQRIELAFRKLK